MKLLFLPLAVGSLVVGGSLPCFAQQPTSPVTLERLLDSKAAEAPAATAEADAGPKRPAETAMRPKDSVRHPDLDKAWKAYEAAVEKVGQSIRAVMKKQFDTAAAKGDLDAAEKWQNAQERFEKSGELPNDADMESAGSTAVAGYSRAKDELGRAYESVVKALTMEKRISQARAVRDEMLQLFKSPPVPALVPKPAAHNVEGVWRWGKHAMVFYSNGTAREFFPDKGSSPLGGRWKAANEKEVSLQLDNGYVVACALSSGGSMVASCRSPDGRSHKVLAKPIAKSSTLWRWFNGVFVELGADGSVNGDPKCRWRKDGGRVVIGWPTGWIDTLALSPDGLRLHGTNQNGVQVSGELVR